LELGPDASDVTQILNAIQRGDLKAADELLPIVYEELRRLAVQKLSREAPGQTLQATALVHEAYIRLVGSRDPGWRTGATSLRLRQRPCGAFLWTGRAGREASSTVAEGSAWNWTTSS